jgi:phenylpropionate dioxygenase-like ring-hydroxylating dioxygenase large terminal subunit
MSESRSNYRQTGDHLMHLIADRWYAILTPDEIPADRPVAFRRLGQELVFWRDGDGRIVAALDICPHRRAKLSPGILKDGCIECPFHGFRFDRSGACVEIPAHPGRPISGAMSLHTFPIREEHGFIWLWTGPSPAPETPVPFFDFPDCSFAGSAFCEDVPTHYTRGIENQLDYAHLPFVHRTTIGRFATSGEITTAVDGDRIRAWVSDPESFFELLGPNIWRLNTGAAWQFLAFVPIDEQNMRYYVRTYQRRVTAPGLDWLVGRIGVVFTRIVLRQDTPVVASQPAAETRLRMGEVLLPSDAPIIAYRRWREQHRAPFEPGRRLRAPPDAAQSTPSAQG